MPDLITDVLDLLEKHGGALYGGEAVTQREHALQAAFAAEQANGGPALIVAALLHDIGHLLPDSWVVAHFRPFLEAVRHPWSP